jgi:hypothetical protein
MIVSSITAFSALPKEYSVCLFISSLMLCFPEQFLMFVFAHLLLAPFYNTSHILTSLLD